MMVGMARTLRVQCDHRFKMEARLHIRFVYPDYSIYIYDGVLLHMRGHMGSYYGH